MSSALGKREVYFLYILFTILTLGRCAPLTARSTLPNRPDQNPFTSAPTTTAHMLRTQEPPLREYNITIAGFAVVRAKSMKIAAKAPVRASFRAKIVDEDNSELAKLDEKQVEPSKWWFARSPELAVEGKTVTVIVSVRHVSSESTLGTVVLITQNEFGEGNLAPFNDVSFDPNPANPARDNAGTFKFWLDTPSDVEGLIFPDKGKQELVFSFIGRDLPKGRNSYKWHLRRSPKGPFVRKGSYIARFKCNSRDPKINQFDFTISFKIE